MNHKVTFQTLILLLGLFSWPVSSQTTKTVGASGANYTSLKQAFDAINTGTLTGAIDLQVIDNTTEPTTGAILYGSKSLYTTITKVSGGSNYTRPVLSFGGDGSGASGTFTVAPTTIASLTLTNSGSGYTSVPTISFVGGVATTAATASVTLTPTSVATIKKLAAGSGYTSVPTVTFDGGGGSGLEATAVLNTGTVASYIITNPGSGYTSVPTATITGGGGSGATASITMTPTSIGSITLLTAGVNYTTIPTVSFYTGAGGFDATATLTVAPTTINAVTLVCRGTGYTSPTVIFTDPTGAGASYITSVGPVNYSTVKIYPTVTGKTISGSGSTNPMIALNGTKNVTLDGRLNATGTEKDLTINFTTINSNQAFSINFAQNAEGNTVKYCTLTGNAPSTVKGILGFDIGYAGNSYGNGNNTISNNTFTGNATGRPALCVYSAGDLNFPNIGNKILNNEFKDFLNPTGTTSAGISFNGNKSAATNKAWIISGNSFYETTSFQPSAAVAYSAILVGATSYGGGTGHTISGNYIGGSAPHCGGLWTKTNTFDNAFAGISLNLNATGVITTVDDNTIKNISWSNSGTASWKGIETITGDANIGCIAGNTIGDNTTSGSITVTESVKAGNVYGILISTSGVVNCKNNTVGSITAANSDATASTFLYGIYKSRFVVGATLISDNTIGGNVANSLYCSSASTASVQDLAGIFVKGTESNTVNKNTISNLTNASAYTSTNKSGSCVGVDFEFGTVTNNVIHDLTIQNLNNGGAYGVASVVGICNNYNTSGYPASVNGNTIYNLSNDNALFAGYVTGISFVGGSATPIAVNTCSGNFVYGLSVNASSTGASISGILGATGVTTYSNNIISLGGNSTVQISGITEGQGNILGNDTYLYHNTVSLSGTPTSGAANSYAFYSASLVNTRILKNNLFVNTRTGGTGTHYGMIANTTNLTRDYNDYIGVASPLKDANSLSVDPLFVTVGGTMAEDYKTSSSVGLTGITGTGVSMDYAGIGRSLTAPRMGAYEISGTTKINEIEKPNVTIIHTASGVIVPLNGESTIELYTVNGLLIDKARAAGTYSHQLNNGMYIISVNGKATKFVK